MSKKKPIIVDIRVPDTIDLVLLETLKAANAIRDENRRRQEQQRYLESVKIEEPDDYDETPSGSHDAGPSTSGEEKVNIENEDFITFAMRTMQVSSEDSDFSKTMTLKRIEFQEKNKLMPIKQSNIVKNAIVEANREYEAEKNARTDIHFRRAAMQKYFPDKRRTHQVFDESLLHNLKNPIVASVYHGNTEEFFQYIHNCPQSAMRMPDKSKCLCLTSFSQAQDSAIHLALSSHIHQKECDQPGNCGRVSCTNGKNYLEIVRRLFKETVKNSHMKEIVHSWLGASYYYIQLCPLGYCLYQGAVDLFEMMISLISKSDIDNNYELMMRRSRCFTELIDEAFVYGVQNKLSTVFTNWQAYTGNKSFTRICSSGRLEAVMSFLSLKGDTDNYLSIVQKAAFSNDYPKYLDILLNSSANRDILSVLDRACVEGAEKCLHAITKNKFWMSEIFDSDSNINRTGLFEIFIKVTRTNNEELFYRLKEMLQKSMEFRNFPFSFNVPDFLYHLAYRRLWKEFTEWLMRLDETKKNSQKYAKAQEYLNLTFRYFVFSTYFDPNELRLILRALISAGAYAQTDSSDYAFLNELKRKDLQDFVKNRDISQNRYIMDLDKEMKVLFLNNPSSNSGIKRAPHNPYVGSLKKPRLH